jgi:hypothetical protein
MRGLNYIKYDRICRFGVIIHFLLQKDVGRIHIFETHNIYFSVPSLFLLIYHTEMINPTGDYHQSEVIAFVSSIMNTVLRSTSYAENLCEVRTFYECIMLNSKDFIMLALAPVANW